ncbi:MAG: hypothetical protein DRQ88_10960 [Epsilonproteobacteria bacterium]|nr:MAG: hypothetical protein DRQ89_11155 [Campylobacterota bacterium]RLA64421.1 MAG: hypothetical protein DRQ88_10960 [Campylobacterota bacterium]
MKTKHQDWLHQYLKNCRQINRSEHTIKNYRADLLKFFIWFEGNHDQLITRADGSTITIYKDFLTKGGTIFKKEKSKVLNRLMNIFKKPNKKLNSPPLLVQGPLSVGSRKRHLSSVSNFFEYLKQTHEDHSKLFAKNPVKPKIHSIKLKEMDINPTMNLRRNDWDKIHDSVYRTRERLIIYLLYWGGLRLAELCNLKTDNFSVKEKSLKFIRKGGYVHHLTFFKGDLIFGQLDYFLKNRRLDSEFLFTNSKGERVTEKTMYNLIMRILKKAGTSEGLTPHSFRKACATNLYLKYKDLLLVRDYLNHKDAKITQTYIDKMTLEGINREKNLVR